MLRETTGSCSAGTREGGAPWRRRADEGHSSGCTSQAPQRGGVVRGFVPLLLITDEENQVQREGQ